MTGGSDASDATSPARVPQPRAAKAERLGQAVAQLADHPALPALIPSLPPATLARLYGAVGLHDAGALMALTPPALLTQALEEAVWGGPGAARFDPDMLVDWLEAWNAEGEEFVADRLVALDEDLLALGFRELVHVEDSYATAYSRQPDDGGDAGDFDSDEPAAGGLLEPGPFTEVFDRFLVAAQQDDEWDVVRDALLALWIHHPERLRALLTRLMPSAAYGADILERQVLQRDAAAGRERRQEEAGFVPVDAARGFLTLASALSLGEITSLTGYDPETARHLRRLASTDWRSADREPPPHLRDPEQAESASAESAGHRVGCAAGPGADPELWSLLAAAGVVDSASPTGLLGGPAAAAEPSTFERYLDDLAGDDPGAFERTAAELAYLANVIRAAVDLDTEQRDASARELAFATVSLGIELLEARGFEVRLGEGAGSIRPFLLGWRTASELPSEVARAFEAALAAPAMTCYLEHRHWLRAQIEEALDDLRSALRGSRFPAAREAVAVLSLAFETDACRAAVHLLGQPPRFPVLLDGGHKDHARWLQSLRDLDRVGTVLANLRPKA